MTSGGTERWSKMRWRALCRAVSKALRASKEKTSLSLPRPSCRCAMNRGEAVFEPGRAPCCQSLTTPCSVSTSVICWVRRPVSSFMSSSPRAMGQ